MKVYTLDKLVRGALADRGYSMHFYIQFLTYGVSALRELNFDVLQSIKSVRIPINNYKAGALPCDYVDFIRVGDEYGQYVQRWGNKTSLNRLNNFDSQGNKIPFSDVESNSTALPTTWEGYAYSSYASSNGEHLGRHFGSKPAFRDSFLIVRERGEIQLDVDFSGTHITMDYISDGMTVDASNAIHPYATETIKAYIFWKMKEHSRAYGPQERQLAKEEFYNQMRVLRGRMNSMDDTDVHRSLINSYGPVIKR
jgi:hypothetical protein